MKHIQAIIRPHRLDFVRDALARCGVLGITVCEISGFGRQQGHPAIYRGREYEISLRPKLSLELVVHDDLVPGVIEAILESARSGKIGDGKIFVSDVDHAVRIRTGEEREAAL